MNKITYSKTGRRHEAMHKTNEDCIGFYQDAQLAVMAVADGASSSNAAGTASRLTVDALLEFSKNPAIWRMKLADLRKQILQVLDKHYLDSNCSYDELCATAVLVAVNYPENRYLAVSVGDCTAVIFDRTLSPSILLAPCNLGSKQQTIFCNDRAAYKRMRLEQGSLHQAAGFLLMTDGCGDAFSAASAAPTLRDLAALTILSEEHAQQELEKIAEEIRAKHTGDDVTAGLMVCGEDTDLNALAKATCTVVLPETEDTETPVPVPEEVTADEEDTPQEEITEEITAVCKIYTAQELCEAFLCEPFELLTALRPLLKMHTAVYENGCFTLTGGGIT